MSEAAGGTSSDQSKTADERDKAIVALLRYRDYLAGDPTKDHLIYFIEMAIFEIAGAPAFSRPGNRLGASRELATIRKSNKASGTRRRAG